MAAAVETAGAEALPPASQAVEEHLEHAATTEGMAEEHHAEPLLWGIAPPAAVVSSAMIVLLAIAFLYAKAHKKIAGGLDGRIAEIKHQLDEAKKLRAEAEALRKEYADKIAGAEKDAEAMLEHARTEAATIVEKAEADTATMITRREKMAQDKIAAAERGAIDELRRKAAAASAAASADLIASNHGAAADKALVDQTITGL